MTSNVDYRRAAPTISSRLIGLLLVSLALVGCSGTPPQGITTLRSASFVGNDSPVARELAVPHQRQPGQQQVGATVEYRLALPDVDPPRGLGVFITIRNAPLAAFVNGIPVFENGDSR